MTHATSSRTWNLTLFFYRSMTHIPYMINLKSLFRSAFKLVRKNKFVLWHQSVVSLDLKFVRWMSSKLHLPNTCWRQSYHPSSTPNLTSNSHFSIKQFGHLKPWSQWCIFGLYTYTNTMYLIHSWIYNVYYTSILDNDKWSNLLG